MTCGEEALMNAHDPSVRRRLLLAGLALPFVPPRIAAGQGLPLTPECGEKPARTPPQTEGPFYTPRSPRRTSLIEPGAKAERLVISGWVLSAQCRPVPNALLDFWHCDETGEYDNRGFRYRGHLFTDAHGRYRLETIVPGEYPGRTRHVHVKVQAPGRRILTTQLYFPNEPRNARDFGWRPELEMRITQREDSRHAVFSFVVEA
jgi:protocatechuate 3,4-dioxygenase beta subunit